MWIKEYTGLCSIEGLRTPPSQCLAKSQPLFECFRVFAGWEGCHSNCDLTPSIDYNCPSSHQSSKLSAGRQAKAKSRIACSPHRNAGQQWCVGTGDAKESCLHNEGVIKQLGVHSSHPTQLLNSGADAHELCDHGSVTCLFIF